MSSRIDNFYFKERKEKKLFPGIDNSVLARSSRSLVWSCSFNFIDHTKVKEKIVSANIIRCYPPDPGCNDVFVPPSINKERKRNEVEHGRHHYYSQAFQISFFHFLMIDRQAFNLLGISLPLRSIITRKWKWRIWKGSGVKERNSCKIAVMKGI